MARSWRRSACRDVPGGRFDELLAAMSVDKKARGSTLHSVILNGLASAEIPGPTEEQLREAAAASPAGDLGRAG